MNKYQKIAFLIGAIVFILIFGKTMTKISFGAMALLGKGIIIIVATLFLIFMFKKASKKK